VNLPVRQPVTDAGAGLRRRRGAYSPLARVVGVALIVGSGAAMYWLTTAAAFRIDPQSIRIGGLAYTDEQQVREAVGLAGDGRPNVFRVHAGAMAEALRSLPSVASAEVVVALPDRLEIDIVEREPLIVWRTGSHAFLADIGGALLAEVAPAGSPLPDPASSASPSPGGSAAPATPLPQVEDLRAASQALAVGARLDAVDMAAARLLLTITAQDVGSLALALQLTIDDEDGYALVSQQPPWRAVFGFYTANLRQPADLVPRQRQCLASILAGGEDRLEVVYLAVAGDSCGTYRDRPTPSALFSQNVGKPVA
jgi:hypothetical protein